jgi:hypothetical protein
MPQEGGPNHGRGAELKRVADALREWARRLENGTLRQARCALKALKWEQASAGRPPTETDEAKRSEADSVLKAHSAAVQLAGKLVSDNLHVLSLCADAYGCSAPAQEAIAWLKATLTRPDAERLLCLYKEESYHDTLKPGTAGKRRCRISVLADAIDAWAVQLEKAEYVRGRYAALSALPLPRGTSRRRGARKLPTAEAERRLGILSRWNQAHEAEVTRQRFCEDEDITPQDLEKYQDWARQRANRNQ